MSYLDEIIDETCASDIPSIDDSQYAEFVGAMLRSAFKAEAKAREKRKKEALSKAERIRSALCL